MNVHKHCVPTRGLNLGVLGIDFGAKWVVRAQEPLVRAGGYDVTSRGPMRLLANDVGPP